MRDSLSIPIFLPGENKQTISSTSALLKHLFEYKTPPRMKAHLKVLMKVEVHLELSIIIRWVDSGLTIEHLNDKERRVALLTLFLGVFGKFTRSCVWTPQQQRKIFDHGTLAFRPSCAPKRTANSKVSTDTSSKARKLSRWSNDGHFKTKTKVITSVQSKQTQISKLGTKKCLTGAKRGKTHEPSNS